MPATPSLDQIITEIDQWFTDTMHNSIASRDVAVYNHVRAACEELKGRIAALVTGKPTPAPVSAEADSAAEEAPKAAADTKIKPAA